MSKQRQKVILLVEDEALIALDEKMVLENYGFQVILENTGEKAVERVENSPIIDLILMDINLVDGIDGTEAAQQILSKKDIPIVFFSSHTEKEVVEKTEGITSYGYIVKNSGDMVLLASIKMAFRLYETKQEVKKQEASILAIFDAVDELVYVADTETYDVIFTNKVVKDQFGPLDHKKCYEYLQNRKTPCPFCTNDKILGEYLGKSYIWEFQNEINKQWYQCIDKAISWPDGRTVRYEMAVDITDLKKTEEARWKSEFLFHSVWDHSNDGMRLTDKGGKIILVNEAFSRIVDMKKSELENKTLDIIYDPHEKKEVLTGYKNNYLNNTFHSYLERELTIWNGKSMWFGVSISRIKIPDEDDLVLSIFRNITVRKIQQNITHAVITASNLNEFYEVIRSELGKVMDTTNFLIALYDKKTDMFYSPFEKDEGDRIPSWPAGKSLSGYVIRNNKPALLHKKDIRNLVSKGEIELIESMSEVWLGVPLKKGIDTTGILVVQCYNNPHAYDNDCLEILETVSNQLTIYIERKQAEETIQKQLSEKETLLKEVHHRIKNNIGSIESLLSLQSKTIQNPEARSALQESIGRVRSMGVLYNKLLLSGEYKDTSVKNYTENLIDTILKLHPDQEKIKVHTSIDNFTLTTKKLFPVGIIINELLTNSLKYAFNEQKSGILHVSLTKKERCIILSIQDNGRGFPEGFDIKQSKGFGLMLVKIMSEQLGGNLSVENKDGACVVLKFET